jgi:heparan-alpha-glucosaminide N-acetyltransferase
MHPGPSDFTYLWGPLLTMFAVMAVAPFLMRVIKKVRKWLESDEGSSSDAKSAQEPSWSVTTGNRDARLNADGYVGLPASANETGDFESARGAADAALAPERKKAGSERLKSLDTMRGLSLSLMIFVNYGGGGYWWLDHSSWNGLTVADLLFPWFMWMMGVSMALAFKARKEQKQTRLAFMRKVCQRSANLVLISLFTDAPWNWPQKLRLTGVLQYFAVSYFWVSLAVLATGSWDGAAARRAVRAVEGDNGENGSVKCRFLPAIFVGRDEHGGGDDDDFAHVRLYWRELGPVLLAPALWLVLTFGVDVPGCGRGYLGPGGFADGGTKFHCTGGSHRYIDHLVFGVRHLYGEPTCMEAYQCVPYDPEGFVGGFNAVLLTYLGLVAGRIFLHHKHPAARMTHLVVLGLPCLAVAAALCGCKQDGGLIPVNKNLWSTSYVLLMAGFGSVLLAGIYGIVDRWQLWDGAPLRYMGMNSIAIYVGSDIFEMYFPFGFHANPRQHWGELLSNCVGVCAWFAVATELYRRKIFFKV